ncbi:hypothetical protein P692DRAFT_20831122, partial [Suillus brevipes Sb2]
ARSGQGLPGGGDSRLNSRASRFTSCSQSLCFISTAIRSGYYRSLFSSRDTIASPVAHQKSQLNIRQPQTPVRLVAGCCYQCYSGAAHCHHTYGICRSSQMIAKEAHH